MTYTIQEKKKATLIAHESDVKTAAIATGASASSIRRWMNSDFGKQAKAVVGFAGTYKGASSSRPLLKLFDPGVGNVNHENEVSRPTLVSRSRDAFRNQPIARGAINRQGISSIGTGLTLISEPNAKILGISSEEAKELSATIESEFHLFANSPDCDIERTQTFYEMQLTLFTNWLINGDSLLNTLFMRGPGSSNLRLQQIDTRRMSNPNRVLDTNTLTGGVSLNRFGAPRSYHISVESGSGVEDMEEEWIELPAFGSRSGRRRAMHLFTKEYPSQVRGVPFLAPALEPLKGIDKYSDAELTAAVVAALYTIFITTEDGELPDQMGQNAADASALGNQDSFSGQDYQLGSGAIIGLGKNESIEVADPKRPNKNMGEFVGAMSDFIGAALNMPASEILMRYEDSYSAARAAMLQAWKGYLVNRSHFANHICTPVFQLWLDEQVARGIIDLKNYGDERMRAAYAQCRWMGPARGAIDEEKEIKAAQEKILTGLSNQQIEAAAMTGADSDRIAEQRAYEMRRNKELGIPDITILKSKSGQSSQQGAENESD